MKPIALILLFLTGCTHFNENIDNETADLRSSFKKSVQIKMNPKNKDEIEKKKVTEKIYGVTLDSIDNMPSVILALENFKVKPTVRVVFDEKMPASYYLEAVNQIHDVAFVMGGLLDSYYVKDYSIEEFQKRSVEYFEALSGKVDIWEIGNEINGEWLGSTESVVKKMSIAYNEAKKHNQKTELTLYYNEGCFEKPDHEVFSWSEKNIPASIKNNLDYVFLSYYEDDCNNLQPNWPLVFKKLAAMFPNSKIGFGEIGSKLKNKKALKTIENH